MCSDVLITVVVFSAVYVLIALEWLNKAIAALLGVMALLIIGMIDEHAAASFIDYETIMLLIGMMGIVAVLKKTGFFALITVRIARLTGGQPLRILILFCLVTAVLSAFLDNVTTVLIMVPIIIELTRGMGLDPKIYVVALAMASNLGGTATLVGDPPNIIIGSKVGLTFNQFAGYLFMPVVLSTVSVIAYFWAANRDSFKSIDDDLTKLFSVQLLIEKIELDFLTVKIDRKFLLKSVVCLGVALLLFVTQSATHLSPGVVALTVAMILFIITCMEIEHMLLEIEWSTLLFFFRPLHPGGCHGAKGRHRMAGPQHFPAGRRQPVHHDADGAVGFGDRFGIYRQHPFYHHHDTHRSNDAGRPSLTKQHLMVGTVSGSLPGRQSDHDRCIGQYHFRRYAQKVRP
jgi:Na+/H+ antiporter NhaD/arsenite permease-like protein